VRDVLFSQAGRDRGRVAGLHSSSASCVVDDRRQPT
jgi:hypothetical protein